MPQLDLIDETFLVAAPADVSAAVHDPAAWRRWWPDLELSVFEDRGESGLRWAVTGAVVGTAELWLEPWGDGVIAHYYLRADVTRRGSASEPRVVRPKRIVKEIRRRAFQVKNALNAMKDELEAGRRVGGPPASRRLPA